jgi:hypothetical protein
MSSSGSKTERLRTSLNSMTEHFVQFMRLVPVKCVKHPNPRHVLDFFMPDYDWEKPSEEARSLQHGIKRDYEIWIGLVKAVFSKAPNDVLKKLNEADKRFRQWLELESDWTLSLKPDFDQNEQKFRKDIYEFNELIRILEAPTNNEIIVIPDTNSIVAVSDPCAYRTLINAEKFTFLLLPTVIGELDILKNNHRNSEFREKVKKSILRIKGWRNQGSLITGVTVDRTIKVRAVIAEPDMKTTLSWLDTKIMDDSVNCKHSRN